MNQIRKRMCSGLHSAWYITAAQLVPGVLPGVAAEWDRQWHRYQNSRSVAHLAGGGLPAFQGSWEARGWYRAVQSPTHMLGHRYCCPDYANKPHGSSASGEPTSDEEKQMLPSCRMVASTAQTAVNSSGHKPSACRAFTSPVKSWASSLPWSLQARPCRAQQGWAAGPGPPALLYPSSSSEPPTKTPPWAGPAARTVWTLPPPG